MNTTEMTSDASKAAGVWGSFTCDLPYWTFEDMLMQIKENHGDVRYLQLKLLPFTNIDIPMSCLRLIIYYVGEKKIIFLEVCKKKF